MNDLVCAFVAAFVVPLLFQSRRIAILCLGIQGILLSMVPALHSHDWSMQFVVESVALFGIRGILAPWLLYKYSIKPGESQEFSLIGRNLFQWAVAGVLLGIAFILGSKLAPEDPSESLQIGTAASCIMIGMLILSNQTCRLGQAIGILTIESGMALIELLSPHPMPFIVSMGVYLVYVVLLATIVMFMMMPEEDDVDSQIAEGKE